MKVLIPLAGRGSRFKEAGLKEPKPLIKIIKQPMIRWATKNLSVDPANMIFFVLKQHVVEYHIDEELRKLFSNQIKVIVVDIITEGAPITLLRAKDLINTDEEILIWNGDQCFEEDIVGMIKALPKEYGGLIPVFTSTQQRFSFVKTDEKMDVIEVAEKVPISNLATIGAYYFRRGKDFVWAAEEMIRKDFRRGNEFFVCPVYNELIHRGMKVRAVKITDAWPLGTPEDVEHFEKYYRGTIEENRR